MGTSHGTLTSVARFTRDLSTASMPDTAQATSGSKRMSRFVSLDGTARLLLAGAITAHGDALTWGGGRFWQLGHGTASQDEPAPLAVHGLAAVREVSTSHPE